MFRSYAVLVLCFLILPVHAALTGGIERDVTLPTADTAAFDQSDAHLASDGRSFFAVWLDHRMSGLSADVFGSFVSEQGRGVGAPIFLGTGDDQANAPAIAFGGGRYLVMWKRGTSLQGRFVDAVGALSPEIEIAPTLGGISEFHVASNGHLFLVVWRDWSLLYRGTIINAAGQIQAAFEVMTAELTFVGDLVAMRETFYALTSFVDLAKPPNGNGFPSAVKAVPIAEDGTVGAPIAIASADTPVFDLRGAPSGNGLLAAWTTAAFIPGGEIRGATVTPQGAESIDGFAADGLRLEAVTEDLLIYGDQKTHFMRRIGGTPAALDVPAFDGDIADATSNGGRTVLIFHGAPRVGFASGPAGGDLYTATVDAQQFTPLVLTPHHQSHPDIAAANDLRLAAWSEYIGRDRRLGVVASRIGVTGQPLDGNGIDLGIATYHPTSPRVASNGKDWLVVWSDGAIYAKRVSHSGVVLDATPILIGSSYSPETLAVAWDGRSYVVAYLRGSFFKGIRVRAFATRVSAEGAASPEIALTDEGPFENIAIAGSGDGSLIVWDAANAFNAVLLSRNDVATPLSLAGLRRPSIAWNGSTFLVAGFAGRQLQWQLVSATGVTRTPSASFIDLVPPAGPSYGWPSVDAEAVGEEFTLVFNDQPPFNTPGELAARVSIAMVNERGFVEEAPIPITFTLGGFERNIATSGAQIVYAREIGDRVHDVMRVFVRTIERTPNGPRRRAVRP